jgi:hypothetical protein
LLVLRLEGEVDEEHLLDDDAVVVQLGGEQPGGVVGRRKASFVASTKRVI